VALAGKVFKVGSHTRSRKHDISVLNGLISVKLTIHNNHVIGIAEKGFKVRVQRTKS